MNCPPTRRSRCPLTVGALVARRSASVENGADGRVVQPANEHESAKWELHGWTSKLCEPLHRVGTDEDIAQDCSSDRGRQRLGEGAPVLRPSRSQVHVSEYV